jgi:hypothetical protein
MTRAILGELIYFLVPFAAFAAYLAIRRRNPFDFAHWSSSSLWLAIAGLACVAVALLGAGIFADNNTGAFVPTHVEDGRVVPGQFR